MSTSNLAAYLKRNARFAGTDAQPDVSEIPFIPFRQDYLITGIDPRMERAAAVGLELGETIVVPLHRWSGHPVDHQGKDLAQVCDLNKNKTPDADRFEVTIIHHTDCGSALSADEELRRSFPAQGGYDEQTHQAPTQTGAIIRAVKTSFVDGLSQASVMCAVVVCVGALPALAAIPGTISPETKQVSLIPEMTRTGASSLSPELIRLGNQEPELTQAESSTSSASSSTTPIPADDPNRHSLWLAPNKTRPR
jgi:carbonic anhydrase